MKFKLICISLFLLPIFGLRDGAHKMGFTLSKLSRSLAKRNDTPGATYVDSFRNNNLLLLANLTVGTPGQNITVIVDTAGGDLWIMARDCSCYTGFYPDPSLVNPNFCLKNGVYDSARSSTFGVYSSASTFLSVYGRTLISKGIYIQDTLSFAGIKVSGMILGLAETSSMIYGALGLGAPRLESSYDSSGFVSRAYHSFPNRLQAEGIINRIVYSIYFENNDYLDGAILFGGVNHAKYSGQLQTVPMILSETSVRNEPVELGIVLSLLGLIGPNANITVGRSPFVVVLDTSSGTSFLPMTILADLVEALDGKFAVHGTGLYEIVDCKYYTLNIQLSFNFSGIIIPIPLSSWIIKTKNSCHLTTGFNNHTFILGNDVLKYFYAVYDLEELQVSLAPVKFGEIDDIESVHSSIPSAVSALYYSETKLPQSIDTSPQKTGVSPAGTTRRSQGICNHLHRPLLSIIAFVSLLFL